MAELDPAARRSFPSRWIILAALVLLFWALKSAYAVFMPVAAASFIVALVYPLYRWTTDRINAILGFIVAFVTVLIGFAVFFGLVGWALATVVSELPQYEEQFRQAYDRVQSFGQSFGFTLPEPRGLIDSSGQSAGFVSNAAGTIGLKLQAFLTNFFIVLAFIALGVTEVSDYSGKLGTIGGMAGQLREAGREVGHKFRAYVGALTVAAAVTAVLTAAFGLAIGLEFALVFALLSFLMNFVPTIGSVIAVIPPTLFSFVQFDGLVMPLVVFAGFAVIELTVGNYVAPKIEGRVLSIAPTVVLAAIVFWGWIWGVVGALLAVPLTIAIALFCKHFDDAWWVGHIIREHDHIPADDDLGHEHGRPERAAKVETR